MMLFIFLSLRQRRAGPTEPAAARALRSSRRRRSRGRRLPGSGARPPLPAFIGRLSPTASPSERLLRARTPPVPPPAVARRTDDWRSIRSPRTGRQRTFRSSTHTGRSDAWRARDRPDRTRASWIQMGVREPHRIRRDFEQAPERSVHLVDEEDGTGDRQGAEDEDAMTVPFGGANRPKLTKMSVSQKRSTPRNSGGIEVPPPPWPVQRASSRLSLSSTARAWSARCRSFCGESPRSRSARVSTPFDTCDGSSRPGRMSSPARSSRSGARRHSSARRGSRWSRVRSGPAPGRARAPRWRSA